MAHAALDFVDLLGEHSDSSEESLILGNSNKTGQSDKLKAIPAQSKDSSETKPQNYETWFAKDIRKECTRRGLRLKTTMRKKERIEALKRFDAATTVYREKLPGDDL
ncbi:hypothetical protein GN244_ATG08225 [Phytophthora infestans]|uniref:Uncharacterized protein n=1 Tax=Phytophthora infestans TaxID=4787 RepID=A0A833S3F3_PHYIN|nr:hypothetical protein GN244_ATG08225 [Phytophthora infestans]KAF4127106.1 hypothetical protein GN958_ATG23703 [Phytophthora infestans]